MINLFKKMIHQGISPNELYLLLCISQKEVPSQINVTTEERKLFSAGYIDEKKAITAKGIELLESLSSKIKVTEKTKKSDYDLSYIENYREIFPKGMLPSGQPSRVPVKELERKFIWFFKVYDYDWETILRATRKYVAEYQANGYLYMKTSGYFISKTEKGVTVSTLASYCDLVSEGEPDSPSYSSHSII